MFTLKNYGYISTHSLRIDLHSLRQLLIEPGSGLSLLASEKASRQFLFAPAGFQDHRVTFGTLQYVTIYTGKETFHAYSLAFCHL